MKETPTQELIALIESQPPPYETAEGVPIPLRYPSKSEADRILSQWEALDSEAPEAGARTNGIIVETVRVAAAVELSDEQAWALIQRTGGADGPLVKKCSEVCFGPKRSNQKEDDENDDPT